MLYIQRNAQEHFAHHGDRNSIFYYPIMKALSCVRLFAAAVSLCRGASAQSNSTYYNPILPGWHSDPSCVHVNETFFCVTSTFISFPGLPIYASGDLINWKLVSHVWNRDAQIPGASRNSVGQQVGMYAATLRYHDDSFYVAVPCKTTIPQVYFVAVEIFPAKLTRNSVSRPGRCGQQHWFGIQDARPI